MRRGARCCLIAALASVACARTPAPPAAAPPATPVAAPPAAPADTGRNAITDALFRNDGEIWALTRDGRVRVWSGDAQPARALALEHVLALAPDGSVAATKTQDGPDSDRLDLWALPMLTRVASRSFEHGIWQVLAVSTTAAALRINFHEHGPHDDCCEPALRPPPWYGVLWYVATDAVVEDRNDPCHDQSVLRDIFQFSADGRRLVCSGGSGVHWLDLPTGRSSGPTLAPEWIPPARPERELEWQAPTKARPRGTPIYDVLSVRLTPNGRDVYVTYDRPQPRPEEPSAPSRERWRFDRWSSEPAGGKPSPVVRLAATATDEYTQLLAISADGQLAVLSERGALTVRRAPRYESERLASEWASAAAVSRDGTRIAIGYLDGRLQLWDARTSRPIAAAGP